MPYTLVIFIAAVWGVVALFIDSSPCPHCRRPCYFWKREIDGIKRAGSDTYDYWAVCKRCGAKLRELHGID